VSEQIENWLQNEIRIGKPITQIYNGVDTETYRPSRGRSAIRAELGIGDDVQLIGVVGRLDPIKDHLTLFRAFELVSKSFPKAQLLIIGDGPERKHLESVAVQNIVFLGNRSDVPAILRGLNIFVLPSLNEGISNTILEAMATALPVVTTRVGGNVELVQEGYTGMLVEPGDHQALASALACYLSDSNLCTRHGQAGRRRVLRFFSIQQMVQAYEAVYRRTSSVKQNN
jgi:glycosyltransferase involved in cell wall biosynthesis